MHFDALTLACMTAELQATIADGRVQQVLMVDENSVGLEIYANQARHYLLLNADRNGSYCYVSREKLRRGLDAQPPLLLLLRKYVRGARLTAVAQPDPTERMVAFHFAQPETGETVLVFEPLGRIANLILRTPAGRILDCLHRVRPGEGRRTLMPGQEYVPLPPVEKLPPLDDGRPDYYAELGRVATAEGKLWRVLVDRIAGVSPTQARELAWRTTGDANAPAAAADLLKLTEALQSLWLPVRDGGWTPGIAVEHEAPLGFAPYAIHFRGEFVPTPSMSEALERYYAARAAGEDRVQGRPDAYAAQRAAVTNRMRQIRTRLERQLAALAADEPAPGAAEALRRDAEWLLALASQVQPRQTALEIDLGEETLVIALDSRKSPVEQAQQMFKRAAKLERAAEFIPRRRRALEGDLAFLEQLAVDLDGAENQPEIAAVQRELDKLGVKSGKPGKRPARAGGAPAGPRRFESATGFEILVGRNARQNDAVTFRHSHPDDLWLHVRNAPGSHVVIRRRGADPDEATIAAAAQLAGYYSSLRNERAADVALTRCRFVSRLAGGRPGQVTIRNEKTVTVPAEIPDTVTESS